jgi:hypothetical protein
LQQIIGIFGITGKLHGETAQVLRIAGEKIVEFYG